MVYMLFLFWCALLDKLGLTHLREQALPGFWQAIWSTLNHRGDLAVPAVASILNLHPP